MTSTPADPGKTGQSQPASATKTRSATHVDLRLVYLLVPAGFLRFFRDSRRRGFRVVRGLHLVLLVVLLVVVLLQGRGVQLVLDGTRRVLARLLGGREG